ncbi:MAG TPA: putative lipid II flippase FtsW [Dehalococcoidia bacterium]|nr:putative lipid II flippase FtsW [Dehalococcoidia bacterium]
MPDYHLLVATVMLLIAGLLAVYTSSFAVAYHEYGDPNYFILRQALFTGLGMVALVFFMKVDYNRLRSWSAPMLLVALVGLVLVLSPLGSEVNGAKRWLIFGPISVQPSEFAKLAVLVYISAWLASRGKEINQFTIGFVPFVLLLSVVAALVVSEPDMGTTVMIVLVACTLFFVAGAPITHLALLLGAGATASYFMIGAREYQLDRLTGFLSAESDPQGLGFQIIQLAVALGSGGPLGIGWAESRQKHLYLPGAHTDGVFAILGEELGFIGLIGVLALFAFFLYRALRVTLKTNDDFGMLLGVGIISWIAFQTLINIAGVTRTIPLTGIPLPFLSYGGSALISLMAGVGILLNVSRYTSDVRYAARARPVAKAPPRPKARRRGPVFERGAA